jgi:hypothetical protein
MVAAISVLYPPVLRVYIAAGVESHFIASQFAATRLSRHFSAQPGQLRVLPRGLPKVLFNSSGICCSSSILVVGPRVDRLLGLYNEVVVLMHQVCMVLVFFLALWKRKLKLASENVYSVAVYSVVFAIGVYHLSLPLSALSLGLHRTVPAPAAPEFQSHERPVPITRMPAAGRGR